MNFHITQVVSNSPNNRKEKVPEAHTSSRNLNSILTVDKLGVFENKRGLRGIQSLLGVRDPEVRNCLAIGDIQGDSRVGIITTRGASGKAFADCPIINCRTDDMAILSRKPVNH